METTEKMAELVDVVEAQKALDEALTTRVTNCSKEIEDILKKYNCRIEVQQVLKVFPNQTQHS